MRRETRFVEGTPFWDSSADEQALLALSPGVPQDLQRRPAVAIVGGGALGLAIGVMCRRFGLDPVVVLERGRLAAGPSGRAGGVLAPEPHVWTDPPKFVELGRRSLRLTAEIDEEWDGALGVRSLDCLLVEPAGPPPFPFEAPVEFLGEEGIRQYEPAVAGACEAVLIRHQARVHPIEFAAALARRAGQVVTGVEVGERVKNRGRVVRIRTSVGDLDPAAVVFATGLAPHPEVSVPHELIKGHVATTQPVPFRLHCQVVTPRGGALPLEEGRLLTGGTLDVGDESPDVQPTTIAAIRRGLDEVLPAASSVAFSHTWCCFRPATPDRLPLIDRVPGAENAWFTSGHYRTGLLMAFATAEAVAQWIASGRRPPSVEGFGLKRFS
jgi:glycine/D-amino acid oxidase-like deaminating enzyme